MNNFFDYIFIRIYQWYESFPNEPSEFTAKLIVAFIQLFLLLDILGFIPYFIIVPSHTMRVMAGLIGLILFYRLHKRYSNKHFVDTLQLKWKSENRVSKTMKVVGIVLLFFAAPILFVLIGHNSPNFNKY